MNKPDDTRYDKTPERDFQQSIGMRIFNVILDFILHEIKLPMMDMRHWNDIMIEDYQCHRSMIETENYDSQAQILDDNYEKPDLEEAVEIYPGTC